MKALNLICISALLAVGSNKLFAQQDTSKSITDSTIIESTIKDPLKEIFSAYIAVSNSLAKGNEDEAGSNGKKLYSLLEGLSMDKPSDEQYAAWTKYSKKLLNDADHIAEMAHLEHQREHFNKLSKNLFEVVRAFKTNSTDIYYHYCSEANDGKGVYWLSDTTKGTNPYLGDKTKECDTVKETLTSINK
jgi:uncharacterized protein DUF3347